MIRLRRAAFSTILLFAFANSPLAAATRTWTGAASSLWSNPANWDGGVPVAGDDLVFPRLSSGQSISTNDLASGTIFHSITVNAEGYRIAGNGIVLGAGGLILNAPFLVSLIHGELKFSSITLADSQTWKGLGSEFTLVGPTNLNGKTLTIINALRLEFESISGTGSLMENALNGYLRINGSSYTGTLTLDAGPAILAGGTAGAVQVNASDIGGDAQVNGRTASLELSGVNVADVAVNGSGALSIHGISGTSYDSGNLAFQPASGNPAWFIIPDGTIPVAINVSGSVTLGNPLLLVNRAITSSFTLIHNQGVDPITGTFLGLPEGAVFGNGMQISYVGGSGHDVTLTPVSRSVTGTTTTVNAAIQTASPGQIVPLTATVSSTAGTPAGNVSFYDGGILLGTSPLNATGQATLTRSYERRLHLFTAAYLGSQLLTASQGNVRVEVCDPPVVAQQPASQSIFAGQFVTLTVQGSPPLPLSFQWYRGLSGDTSSPIGATNSATLALGALTRTLSFWVQISNACGSAQSATATITIQQPRRRSASH